MFAVRNIETVRSRENFGLFKLELQSFHDVCRTVNTDYGPILCEISHLAICLLHNSK